jgi:MFS family permease
LAKHAYRQLVLGMIGLFIVMAIGRFAYTPILPFMKHTGMMNDQSAGLLATINYLGYLIGAIIPLGFIFKSKVIDLKIYLIINILTTILMGFTEQYIIWSVYRVLSGITSGAVFVLASNVVLEALKQGRRESISGLLYSAVGIGIFSSSIFIYFFTTDARWQATWIILGICSLIGGLLVVIGMTENQTAKQDNDGHKHIQQQEQRFPKFMRYFSIAYFVKARAI